MTLFAWAFLFWLGLLVVAIAFGAGREFLLTPRLGDTAARAVGTLALCAVDFALIRVFVGRMGIKEAGTLWGLGVFWVVLTLAFEFGFGRWRGMSWGELLADYNVLQGRLWVLVLVTLLVGAVL